MPPHPQPFSPAKPLGEARDWPGEEGSQSFGFLGLHRSLPNLHALRIFIRPPAWTWGER
jgi:hypothetical protein